MNVQFEMFERPSVEVEGKAPPLSTPAIAFIVEIAASLDRGGYPLRGRVDYVRSFIRIGCQSPFSNRQGLCREITRILYAYDSLPWRIREEVERLRPAAREELSRKARRMFP
jgi:hypothetical protein